MADGPPSDPVMNSLQISRVLRVRQSYFTYDDNDWGIHFLAGQAYSLVNQYSVGITPRKENLPVGVDQNWVVGFNFTRQWQVRFVKEFDPTLQIK